MNVSHFAVRIAGVGCVLLGTTFSHLSPIHASPMLEISDTFTTGAPERNAGDSLDGAPVETAPDDLSWEAHGGLVFHEDNDIRFDGSGQTGARWGTFAYDFDADNHPVVRVSGDLKIDEVSWMAIGLFADDGSVNSNGQVYLQMGPAGGWSLDEVNGTLESGSVDGYDTDEFITLALEYDVVNQTISAFIGDELVVGSHDVSAIAGDWQINYAGFHFQLGGGSGRPGGPSRVSDFSLQVIPEPASLGLFAVGGGFVLLGRRR